MEISLGSRVKHAWNAFMNKDPTRYTTYSSGSFYRPDRPRFTHGNDRSIMTAICNRIAMDVSAIQIKHCRLDKDDRFKEEIDSTLNRCLNLEANVDQTGRAFVQDIVMSLLDEGCVCIVPTDIDTSPTKTRILEMRVGKIVQWYPDRVTVNLYNERTGNKEDVTLPKRMVAIIENPLYAVMNEPSSTMQRLIRTLSLVDMVDQKNSSGKLDMIIQLPYVIKTEARRQQAEQRRKDIEMQLATSTYGIAYTDGTEKITQLNRAIDNNLMSRVEYLQNMLFAQLGITQEILNGTADEKTMLNYYSRTIEPIISAIVDEMKRKFLTETARTQKQSIIFFRDPFKLVPINDIAEIADKFTRNEIMTSNEIRQKIGMKPSDDPKADQLVNSNISQPNDKSMEQYPSEEDYDDEYKDN